MSTYTRQTLISDLALQEDVGSNAAATRILDFIEAKVKEQVAAGNEVAFSQKFGKFYPVTQKGKTGKVPGQPGKTYTTQDKQVPKFKASKAFKEAVAK